MKLSRAFCALVLVIALCNLTALAGVPGDKAGAGLPRVVRYSGSITDEMGKGRAGSVAITFAIYQRQQGGAPLWLETQNVTLDEQGRYTVLLGAASGSGLPVELFASGEARWLGVRVAEEGAAEQARVALVSVPYALASGDAQSLGGRPVSDFQLTKAAAQASGDAQAVGSATSGAVNSSANTVNRIAKFTATDEVGDSQLFDNGTNVGLGTTSPTDKLHVNGAIRFGPGSFTAGVGKFYVDAQHGTLLTATTGTTNDLGIVATSGNLLLTNPTGTNNLVMLSGGGFGVNTSNITEKLTVNGGIAFGPSSFSAGSPTLYKDAAHGSVLTGSQGSQNDLALVSRVGNLLLTNPTATNNLVFFSGGNFGLNTFTPTDLLHVNGAIRFGAGSFTAGVGKLYTSPQHGTLLTGNTGSSNDLALVTTAGNLLLANPTGTNNLSFTSGNLGLGTTTPTSKLHVTGSTPDQLVIVTQAQAGAGSFSVGTPPPVAVRGDATSATGVTAGVLGITSAPLGRGVLGESLSTTGQNMGVYGVAVNSPDGTGVWGESTSTTGDAAGVFGRSASTTGTGVFGEAIATSGDAAGVAGVSRAAGGTGVQGEVTAATGENYGISGRVFNNATAGSTAGMFINTNTNAATGSLLLGRTSTAGGAANVFRVDTAGKGFFNGGTQTGGADFAESVAVREERSAYEPGDVIAIDTHGERRFAKVAKPYSTLVAGIYSTKPGVLATPHHPEDPRIASEEIPLAVVGIVPCKVTNENGAIQAGDLLVASSRAGYAMKGTDRKRMNGAVIGKALQPLKGAAGVIEVLVSLQ